VRRLPAAERHVVAGAVGDEDGAGPAPRLAREAGREPGGRRDLVGGARRTEAAQQDLTHPARSLCL
jgi:hypothetical protein